MGGALFDTPGEGMNIYINPLSDKGGTFKWPRHAWDWEAEFYRKHGVEIVTARARE